MKLKREGLFMRELMPYIWTAIILFSAVSGISTVSRAPLRLIPAGLVSFILSLSGAAVWRQVLLFFILAPVLFILFRAFSKKINKRPGLIIGSAAIVTEEINNLKETGLIRINGLAHSARAEENDVIYEKGLVVTVVEIDGTTAVCSR